MVQETKQLPCFLSVNLCSTAEANSAQQVDHSDMMERKH